MSEPDDKLQEHRGQPFDRGFDPEIFRQLVQNQAQELEIRREENDLRRRSLELGHEQAQRAIDAQLEDRQRDRNHLNIINRRGFWITLVFLLLLFGVICYAFYLNKDQLVLELAKYIGIFLAGGIGGYGLKAVQEKKDDGK